MCCGCFACVIVILVWLCCHFLSFVSVRIHVGEPLCIEECAGVGLCVSRGFYVLHGILCVVSVHDSVCGELYLYVVLLVWYVVVASVCVLCC